jgi:hypothetical protein
MALCESIIILEEKIRLCLQILQEHRRRNGSLTIYIDFIYFILTHFVCNYNLFFICTYHSTILVLLKNVYHD